MSEARAGNSLLSPRMAIGLVVVSALSALAFLALSAYAPDLRSETSGGNSVLSKSAVGFAGLRLLLQSADVDVTIGRETPSDDDPSSLVVLTPEMGTNPKDIVPLSAPGPRLIILPKWIVTPDPIHNGWVTRLGSFDSGQIAALLAPIAKGAKIEQRGGTAKTPLKAQFPRFAPDAAVGPVSVDTLQTISGPGLEPDVVDDHGKAVLVQIKGSQTYILAEPDLLNNLGLADTGRARIGVAILQGMRVGDGPVTLDVTLNGFRRSPDILRTVFSPPFLSATLCAILAAAFLAYHAMNRFGSPERPDRVFAFGKRALADNTAAVIRMMKREPAMAPRYAQAALHQAAGFFGVSREKSADPSVIRALEVRNKVSTGFAELNAEATGVRDTGALMRVAEKIYRWRREITHGHI